MKEIASRIANEPKVSRSFRLTIITQGSNEVIVAKAFDANIREYKVPPVDKETMVDSNAAGDAFAGGFLSQWIQNKSLDTCIHCAIYCASESLKQLGANLPSHAPKFVE